VEFARIAEKEEINKKNSLMKFKPDWKIIVFLLIVALAIFLRVYNFSDWLFFKMDQARDASTIRQALELGPGWLPLLGPKAGGTDLNLGPAFYYFQYIAAVLFQSSHPAVLAFPDLLFGILSIPLFYIFAKKYFSRDWSMILMSLYAVCFLGVQYSRFAWNPNGLVFFNLLFFLSLLNVFDESRKYRLRWVILAGASFAISTQLHFLSFLTLPVITILFIGLNWKESKKALNWKYILLFLAIVALVYLPMILNEIVSKGENTYQFMLALKEKPSAHSFWKNVNRDTRYWGQNWFLILTSWISRKGGTNSATLAWLGAILPALFVGFRSFRREKKTAKKNFILISLLWFSVYFLTYIPVAYQIRPRFFLPLIELPFIFIGYLAIFFWQKRHVFWKICVATALLIVFLGNLAGTLAWFKEIQAAQKKGTYPWRTIILKAKDGIVLWHLEKATEYMKTNCPSKEIYYEAPAEYKRPVKYLLEQEGINAVSINNLETGNEEKCVFALGLTRTKKLPIDKKLQAEFEAGEQNKIGALGAYKLGLKENFAGQPLSTYKSGEEENEKSNRIFWKDLWK
jgi:4-amino-4-deoxy-L-arabinose transferase-like glycosyltransferase